MTRKHAHYFRSVEHLKEIDIYRFLDLFGVTDQALGHAIKKLVVPGMRGGGKTSRKDIEEAIDTLQRKLEMMDEDGKKEPVSFSEAIESTPDEFQIDPETEWIDWNGGKRPVNHNQHVVIQTKNGNHEEGRAEDFYWQHFGIGFDIIKYAVVK